MIKVVIGLFVFSCLSVFANIQQYSVNNRISIELKEAKVKLDIVQKEYHDFVVKVNEDFKKVEQDANSRKKTINKIKSNPVSKNYNSRIPDYFIEQLHQRKK